MFFAKYLKFVVDSESGLLWRLTCKALYYLDRFNAKTRRSAIVPFLNRFYPRIPVVLYDLGAAGGIDPVFTQLLALTDVKVIGFDPDKKDVESRESTAKIRFYPYAIGGKRETRTLFVTRSSGCSSLYPPNTSNLKEYPVSDLFEVIRTEPFDVTTLDDFVEQTNAPYPDFLKMDVQGAEYEILKNGGRALEKTIGVFFETRLRELYMGEGLFPASHTLLVDLGFRLISKGGRSIHFSGETLEMDVAYVRGINSLTTPEQVIKAVLFCVCHENLVYAAHLIRSSSLAADEKTALLRLLRKDFGFAEAPETLLMKMAVDRLNAKVNT